MGLVDYIVGRTAMSARLAVALVVAALILLPRSLAAQDDFDRWWKPELDATVAAPGNHRVVFENDEVRVLEVTVPPGTREPLHVHRLPAVIYLESSPHLIEHLQDGGVRDLGARPGNVRWLPVSQGHAMENVDSFPLRAIRVELKKAR
jgi:quercetin dioxygenase-like cupin family protein